MSGVSIVFLMVPEPLTLANGDARRREMVAKVPGKILEVGPIEMADLTSTTIFPGYNVPHWGTRVIGSPNFGIALLPGADLARVKSLVESEMVEASSDERDWNFEVDYKMNIIRNPNYLRDTPVLERVRCTKRHRRWQFLLDEAEGVKPNIRTQIRDLDAFVLKTSAVAEPVGTKRDGRDILYTWNDFKQHILDHQTGKRERRLH